MNKFPRPGSLLFPVFVLSTFILIFGLTGCKEDEGKEEPPINADSVRHHIIPIQEAIWLTSHFRHTVDTLNKLCPAVKDSLQTGLSESFNKDVFRVLLKQKDTAGNPAFGVRIYYGLGKDGKLKLVMVPYDKDGNDIITKYSLDGGQKPAEKTRTLSATATSGDAMEDGQRCPTVCPTSSPLTGN